MFVLTESILNWISQVGLMHPNHVVGSQLLLHIYVQLSTNWARYSVRAQQFIVPDFDPEVNRNTQKKKSVTIANI